MSHLDAQIVRLYDTVFDRAPDAEGRAFWNNNLDAGHSLNYLAERFMVAPEFAASYGQPTNLSFVQSMYENILDRPGEAEGVAFWTEALDSGRGNRADILIAFSESPEHIAEMGRPDGEIRNVKGGKAGETLLGTLASEHLNGGNGDDRIYGDGVAPGVIILGSEPNTMLGSKYIGGDDKIWGGQGNDWISGGHGADWLWGGQGADVFSFGSHIPFYPQATTPRHYVLDTGAGAGARDIIFDFEQGEDLIDLSLLLTFQYRHLNYDYAYEFIGTAAFTGETAQVRYETQGGRTIVQLDGQLYGSGPSNYRVDGVVDGEIELVGHFALQATNFIL